MAQWVSIGPTATTAPGGLTGISVSHTPDLVLGGPTSQGIMVWDGTQWNLMSNTEACTLFQVDPQNSANVHVFDTALRRSTPGGWHATSNMHGPAETADLAVHPLSAGHLLLVLDNLIFYSDRNGDNWEPVLAVVGKSCRLAYSPAAVNWASCYAATSDGHVYRSLAFGQLGSWTVPYTGPHHPTNIQVIACDWSDENLVYGAGVVGQQVLVKRSADAGVDWSAAGEFTAPAVVDLVIDQNDSALVYVAPSTGVFCNGGASCI